MRITTTLHRFHNPNVIFAGAFETRIAGALFGLPKGPRVVPVFAVGVPRIMCGITFFFQRAPTMWADCIDGRCGAFLEVQCCATLCDEAFMRQLVVTPTCTSVDMLELTERVSTSVVILELV